MNGARPVAVVTGGAGFIGSHMVDALLGHGYRVRVIDNLSGGRMANLADHASNPDLSFEEVDIRHLVPEASAFRGANYVLHFAGIGDIVPSIERPTEYMDTNIQGTVHVLEAARHARDAVGNVGKAAPPVAADDAEEGDGCFGHFFFVV